MKVIRSIELKMYEALASLHIMRSRMIKAMAAFATMLVSQHASAADDWWGQINSMTDGLSSTQTGFIRAVQAIGVVVFFIGLVNWYNKSNRNGDATFKGIVICLVVGALMVVMPQFLSSSSKSVGMDGTTVS